MRRTTGSRSSPRNMCSVLQSPIPSAPSFLAFAASAPVSALARTFRHAGSDESAHRAASRARAADSAWVSATFPTTTCPVVPSSEIHSPSATTVSPDPERAPVDLHRLGPDHCGLSPTAGHHGRVADEPTTRREDALRGEHSVDILG